MPDDKQDIILDLIREFRSETNDHFERINGRLRSAETKLAEHCEKIIYLEARPNATKAIIIVGGILGLLLTGLKLIG